MNDIFIIYCYFFILGILWSDDGHRRSIVCRRCQNANYEDQGRSQDGRSGTFGGPASCSVAPDDEEPVYQPVSNSLTKVQGVEEENVT